MIRLYVGQYRLIQELCGGTGVVGVTDDVRVTNNVEVMDDAGVMYNVTFFVMHSQ